MNIAVLTIRSLTKSIVNQLRFCGIKQLREGQVLGFMVNVNKSFHRVMLIEHEGQYFLHGIGYTREAHRHRIVTSKVYKAFATAEECDNYWEAYTTALEKAKEQIFV